MKIRRLNHTRSQRRGPSRTFTGVPSRSPPSREIITNARYDKPESTTIAPACQTGQKPQPTPLVDQYRIKTDKRNGITSAPNRPDDPEYIVRLVGQVVQVSLETVKIVAALPADYGAGSTTQ